MFRAGNQCLLDQKSVASQFEAEVFLNDAQKLLPELAAENGWIRSGLRIRETFKNMISSYRLIGVTPLTEGKPRAEALLVKTQVGINAVAAADACARLVCEHLAEAGADLALIALASPAESGYVSLLVRSPRICGLELPQDILDYMCVSAIKRHLQTACGLGEAMLDGYFSQDCVLFDDSVIAARAREMDKALRTMKFCDPAAGSGQVARAMANAVARARLGLNRYLGSSERSAEHFFTNFLTRSLYVCDSDAGALASLRMQIKLSAPEAELSNSHFVWGRILVEDLFRKTEFDIVASNPPHARQEQFAPLRDKLSSYRSFGSAADLYCYYAERAFELVREHGVVVLLTSNRWLRAGYGAGLRGLLAEKRLCELVDYGDIPALEGSVTPLSVATAVNEPPSGSCRLVEVEAREHEPLPLLAEETFRLLPQPNSGADWTFSSGGAEELMKKIFAAGKPLGEYVGGKVSRGLLTGFNEAFVLKAAEAQKLLARNARNAEALRPFLSGRNVKRYAAPAVRKYLITFPRGITDRQRGDAEPEEWLAVNYPDLARRLAPFESRAARRRDKGDYWWELRSCRYYDDFANAKIICPSIVKRLSATLDKSGLLSNDKTSIICSDSYYLLGLLNSSLMDFCFRRLAPELLNGYFELKPSLLSSLPVREISPTNSRQVKLRGEIELGAMTLSDLCCRNELTDEEKLRRQQAERTIDRAVFRLYRLSPAEISLVLNN